MSTAYHSKYFASELTRRWSSDKLEKLSQSLFNATVDLNPHQLDAALFAFRSPLSRGAILADEVGLGKTIEAGLVISQLWAEHKRRILIIVPSTLRKQWAMELIEKFHIPSVIVDSREYNLRRKAGAANPLAVDDAVTIVTYQFARSKADDISKQPWNLVVIDEAHRLRNVYKPGNKIANSIKNSIGNRPVLLLTATPLQNSLLELYGLISFVDEHLFGDAKSFRARYMRVPADERQLQDLRQRLHPVCKRTLRRQVAEYVRFTNRIPITEAFSPTETERMLYDKVSDYLRRPDLHALPAGQRRLMTMVLRKLLASSTYAIAGTLKALAERLEQSLPGAPGLEDPLAEDFDVFDETAEEWAGEDEEAVTEPNVEEEFDVKAEIRELKEYGDLAASIVNNAKGLALLSALEKGFVELEKLEASRQAVIFTESRRTQEYLFKLLTDHGYDGRVLTINGTNADDKSGAIYRAWLERHKGDPITKGDKAVNLRAAIVEHFRDHADIMIATEAAAEGVNLQFCSLVVNYDLPWNPQRIEQRIGRCHRYGQKHDVVVINFLNRENEADQRVFELLSVKFKLFKGVLESSDEVLGVLESGVDFERRVADIYQSCRTTEEIDASFNQLRAELEEQIAARMADTRRAVLENLDEEVHKRLRIDLENKEACLSRLERALWAVTRYELSGAAEFDEDNYEFNLRTQTADWPEVPTGRYQFATRAREAQGGHAYRTGHPLAEAAKNRALERELSPVEIVFDYTNRRHPQKVGMIGDQVGRSGWLAIKKVSIESLDNEDYLLCAVLDGDGHELPSEFGEKLFQIEGRVAGAADIPAEITLKLEHRFNELQHAIFDQITERNSRFFDEEDEKLDRWADDRKLGLETELKDLDIQIKHTRKEAKLAPDLQTKLALKRRVNEIEAERAQKRREYYEAQDQIEAEKEELISRTETRLNRQVETQTIFTIRWRVQ